MWYFVKINFLSHNKQLALRWLQVGKLTGGHKLCLMKKLGQVIMLSPNQQQRVKSFWEPSSESRGHVIGRVIVSWAQQTTNGQAHCSSPKQGGLLIWAQEWQWSTIQCNTKRFLDHIRSPVCRRTLVIQAQTMYAAHGSESLQPISMITYATT